MKIAKIAVENTNLSFDMLFSYAVPEAMTVQCGCRVCVPFGRGDTERQGFVFEIEELDENAPAYSETKLKSILAVLEKAPLLNFEMLKLALWLKETTFCPLFDAAKAMLPPGSCMSAVITYIISPEFDKGIIAELDSQEKAVCELLLKRGKYVKKELILKAAGLDARSDILEKLTEKGYVKTNIASPKPSGEKSLKMVTLNLDEEELSRLEQGMNAKQKSVVENLRSLDSAEIGELCYLSGVTTAVIMTLVNKGILSLFEKEAVKEDFAGEIQEAANEISLSTEQQKCFESLRDEYNNKTGRPSLLFGVTGSGKTSVYLKMIEHVLPLGKGIIVMVPEIALTPQTLSIFYSRFGDKIAVFHSGLTISERLSQWKRVKSGKAQIAIGTRSCVFAPFESLALIIIDEEQEHTYKSEMSPRYHARDVARFRASINNALLLLSSATPSIESYAAAKSGKYNLCTLQNRYGSARLPEVIVVDMSLKENKGLAISNTLFELLKRNFENHEQSILLINRRGFNTFVACSGCKHVVTCPSCSISLIFHSANNRLMCHYCGYSTPYSPVCPDCGSEALRYSGYGTQRICADLEQLLPDARVLRMDADTTHSRNAYEEKFKAFAGGEYDILLGTQMVAKGLDFENVTLVGVISVDQQLNNDDFKSMERTFDLLTQVVGRSGRGKKSGKAVLQTLLPENDIIQLASKQDYISYYEMEIAIRRAMIYPPFCDICSIVFVGAVEIHAMNAAKWFLETLKHMNSADYSDLKLIVLGPMPLRVAKVSNKYRCRLMIKCRNSPRLREFISKLLGKFSLEKQFSKITAIADINPASL